MDRNTIFCIVLLAWVILVSIIAFFWFYAIGEGM